LMNIFEYAFNTNPNVSNAPPVSYSLTADHLRLTFKRTHPAPADLTYLFEVTDDLNSAQWQSGAAFTSQTIADNLDGTETVTVTDLKTISTSAAHYLRIRISRN
jgi:hypothetical protein